MSIETTIEKNTAALVALTEVFKAYVTASQTAAVPPPVAQPTKPAKKETAPQEPQQIATTPAATTPPPAAPEASGPKALDYMTDVAVPFTALLKAGRKDEAKGVIAALTPEGKGPFKSLETVCREDCDNAKPHSQEKLARALELIAKAAA
jgi:hypothetical protein